jgi:endonuclease I
VGRKNGALFSAWDKADPVSNWEFTRTRQLEKIQGNVNPFVGPVGSSGHRPKAAD